MKDLFVWIDVFFGIRNMKTSRNLSALINLYLDNTETDKIFIYESGAEFLIIGDLCLWWSNFPYASGYLVSHPSYSLPSITPTVRDFNKILRRYLRYNMRMPDKKTMWRLYKVTKSVSRGEV